jgi:hypothetical protein
MKSEELHEGKNKTINLGADPRKKSSRETFQCGSASPEDDLSRRTRSNLFHGVLHTKSSDKPHLLPTR